MKQLSLLMSHARHRAPIIRLNVDRSRELIIDSFAGGGGASTGIEMTTKHRMGLVTVHGEDYRIVDIGMRMLQPRELARAQGFGERYDIETGADGRPLSKTAQVRMIGNSVCPPVACAMVASNYAERRAVRRAAR